AHARCGCDHHLAAAAAPGDPGVVRTDRPRLRAYPADLQLRDADPGAAASAGPGDRGDDVAGLRRGPTGVAAGRPVDRRRRTARRVLRARAADPGHRRALHPAAVVARTEPRAG